MSPGDFSLGKSKQVIWTTLRESVTDVQRVRHASKEVVSPLPIAYFRNKSSVDLAREWLESQLRKTCRGTIYRRMSGSLLIRLI